MNHKRDELRLRAWLASQQQPLTSTPSQINSRTKERKRVFYFGLGTTIAFIVVVASSTIDITFSVKTSGPNQRLAIEYQGPSKKAPETHCNPGQTGTIIYVLV